MAAQVLLIVVAYGVTLWLIDPGPIAPSRWLTVAGLVVGTALVVRLLSERIDRLVAALEAAAHTDCLTGLPNRRAFEERLARERARADRSLRPLAVLAADVDRLEQINDRWGHASGDAALAAVAEALRETVRHADAPARLGGDECAALLPETGAEEAQIVADRRREAVSARRDQGGCPLSLSVGIAIHSPAAGTQDDVMRNADAALYAAKRAGTARASPPPRPARSAVRVRARPRSAARTAHRRRRRG